MDEPQLPPSEGVVSLGGGMACLSKASAAELRPQALYLMLDSSRSMLEPVGDAVGADTGATKWEAVQRAIRSFMQETLDTDLSLGLQFFPLLKPQSSFTCTSHADCGPDGGPCFLNTCVQGNTLTLCMSNADCPGTGNECVQFGLCANSDPDAPLACVLGAGACADGLGACEDFERTCINATECTAASYAAPAVELALISTNLNQIDQAIASREPQGLTPSGPALEGALTHAREWAASHPEHTVVTVLATDGLPTECGSEPGEIPPIEEVTTIAAAGLAGDVPVRTFVIGVSQPSDTVSIENLDAIALAGGTEQAVYIDASGEVEQQFLTGLRDVQNSVAICRVDLSASTGLDFSRADLRFEAGSGTTTLLPYVNDLAGCATNREGWYYNPLPAAGEPRWVELCPDLCQRIRATPESGLSIEIGCAGTN